MAKAIAGASMPAMRYSIASLYNVLTDMIANPTLTGKHQHFNLINKQVLVITIVSAC
jgi:hypothetical protein